MADVGTQRESCQHVCLLGCCCCCYDSTDYDDIMVGSYCSCCCNNGEIGLNREMCELSVYR